MPIAVNCRLQNTEDSTAVVSNDSKQPTLYPSQTVGRSRGWLVRLALGLLVTPVGTAAQVEVGRLDGTVVDSAGTPLSGVSLSLSGQGASRLQTTDTHGGYRFVRLDPGRYRLTAELDGFAPLEYPKIDIRAGRDTTVSLKLHQEFGEMITVNAESPLLDRRKLAQGTVMARLDLAHVPTAGDPWSLVSQSPGVLIDQIDVGGSNNSQGRFTAPGVDVGQNDWLLDGVQITNMEGFLNNSPMYYDLGQFEQVEFSTGGNDLSKNTAGVSINLVTKRGINEIRGSARYLITGRELFWFFKQSSPNVEPEDFPPGQDTEIEATELDRIQNYGLELGGPLIRNRLWLWVSAGSNDYAATRVNGFPDESYTEQLALKLNAQLSASNSLLVGWNDGDKTAPNAAWGPTRSRESAWDQSGPGAEVLKIEDTQIVGTQLYLTGTFARVDGTFSLISNGCIAAGGCEAAIETVTNADGIRLNSSWGGVIEYPSREWKVVGSYFFSFGTLDHELDFGGRFRDFESYEPFHWPGRRDIGHYNGEWWGGLPEGVSEFEAQRGEGPPVTQDYTSLWLQDTLTFGSWTLNAGLRYDLQRGENPPFSVPANPAVPEYLPALDFAGNEGGGFDWVSVSPRLGLTYALGAERNTLLRASFSRFPSALTRTEIARVNPVSEAYAYFQFADVNGNDMWDGREEDFWFDFPFGYDPEDPTALTSPNRTDPGLDPELTEEIILGVEHALRPELVIGAHLTWRKTTDVLEERTLLRELDSGTERVARREDYIFFDSLEITQPNDQRYVVDYYTLDPNRYRPTGGTLLINGEREVRYRGAALTLTKRLSNRWMARGLINYADPEWNIPASFYAFDDPTDAPAEDLRASDNNGDIFGQSSGPFLLLQSGWSFNLNGMVEIAPERRWGFNVAGNVYGREGYPVPLFARQFVPREGQKSAQATDSTDEFRYDDLYTVDLRVEKELHVWSDGSVTLSADLFNAFNNGVVLERETRLNSNFANFVLNTLSPRIWRLGLRLNWR